MLLKLMGTEDLPDDNPAKDCLLLANVNSVKYRKNTEDKTAYLDVSYDTPLNGLIAETFHLNANAYLMNDAGKTIQAYSPHVFLMT